MNRPVMTQQYDFLGASLRVQCDDAQVAAFVATDFSQFRSATCEAPDVVIRLSLADLPYERIPEGTPATAYTKDAVVYKQADTVYLDSFGTALTICDHGRRQYEIVAPNRELLVEKAYLMVMSRVGELLDQRGMHRIHAMAVARNGKAVLCLMPSGGGKTTLALQLMRLPGFSLLSEEAPLVDRRGTLHALPIRIGVKRGTSLDIPAPFLKEFNRTQYGPKTLIDTAYFKERLAWTAEPGFIFLGKRVHTAEPRIVPISKVRAFQGLFWMGVLGVGLPQLLEYVLRLDLSDPIRRVPIGWSRVRACLALLSRSRCYELRLGYRPEANAREVAAFLRNHGERSA